MASSPNTTPPPIPSSDTDTLVHGAPTKESRLCEYFLVISYGDQLTLRQTSPLMDIFDHYHRNVAAHHRKKRKKKRRSECKEDHPLPRARTLPTTTTAIDIATETETETEPELADNDFNALRFEPKVVDRFPPLDHADTALISSDTKLQYFCLPTGLFLTRSPSLPMFYTFVWTPETGDHLFGCCLRFFEAVDPSLIQSFCHDQQSTSTSSSHSRSRTLADCRGYFAPKCIVIISYHAFLDGYRTFLSELYRLSLTPNAVPIERYLCNFFLECPLPPRGHFSVRYNIGDKSFVMARAPTNAPLSRCSISTRALFELFGLDEMLCIYKALLLEEKVLLVSSQYSILSMLCETLVSLLYPFQWPHVYIPLLPEDFLAFLKAPGVFLIGTHHSLLAPIAHDLDDDIVLVDVDRGTVHVGFEHYRNVVHRNSITNSTPVDSGNQNQNENLTQTQSSSSLLLYPTHMHVELPKHEHAKLVRFLEPVSRLLRGAHAQDFHQFDLAFQAAPTPDMVEPAIDASDANGYKHMNGHGTNESQSQSRSGNSNSGQKRKFSLNFRFKRPTLSKNLSFTQLGMNMRSRSDSIEPPIKTSSITVHDEMANSTSTKLKASQSSASGASLLEDIMEVPSLNGHGHGGGAGGDDGVVTMALFDDAAVRNGFLRFWLSIFRSYEECVIYAATGPPPPPPPPNAATIYEDSTDKTTLTHLIPPLSAMMDRDDDECTNDDEEEDGVVPGTPKRKSSPNKLSPQLTPQLSKSKSKSLSSVTASSYNSNHNSQQQQQPMVFGQSGQSFFDADRFVRAAPAQSRPFLRLFLATEAFQRFITKCVCEPQHCDVQYFNEKITEKLNRSRFTKAQATPFLHDENSLISHEFTCPPPDIADLDPTQKFSYAVWPQLSGALYTKARRKYASHTMTMTMSSTKENTIVSNYAHAALHDESSGTFEPSKSRTSTVATKKHDRDKTDSMVLKLGHDFNHENDRDANPFSHDRVTYHLWFYIFLRTLQPNSSAKQSQQERALHLMIKIMAQMKNENVGLPDKWVFLELIESMVRMQWTRHLLKLVEVMNELRYSLDAALYSALLTALTAHFGDLESAYNALGALNGSAHDHSNPDTTTRSRKNSLLLNCSVKPENKRKKYYETVQELQNRFSLTFPRRCIVVQQKCPMCSAAVHDVHIRLGWPNTDESFDTKCPDCSQPFPAKFLVKDTEQYTLRVPPRAHQNLASKLQFFRMRGDDGGTYVKNITLNTARVAIGDQIMAINGHRVSSLSLDEIMAMLKQPPTPVAVAAQMVPVEYSVSVSASQLSQHSQPSEDDTTATSSARSMHHSKGPRPPPPPPPPPQKMSSKAKLVALMKRSSSTRDQKKHKTTQNNVQAPIILTFRSVTLCPYYSPLILYREIRKLIQSHALRKSSVHAETEEKEENRRPSSQTEIQKLLQQSGISAISSIEFRTKHSELFWNLAWHFTNLRLPLHFLQDCFETPNEISAPSIDELIEFVPLQNMK